MLNEDLCYLPAIELAAAIRTRRLSPVELTAANLNRIAELNSKLNAYCTVVPEAAIAAARQAEAAAPRQSVDEGGPHLRGQYAVVSQFHISKPEMTR